MVPGVSVDVGPDLPDKPDRAAAVTRGPGGRVEHEGLVDRGSFTVRMRGPIRDSETPELDLTALRNAVEATSFPLELGGHAVVSIWPSGPSYPLPGPDNGRRYEFVQVFNLQVSTDI
jgi:hypothetical protein